MNEIFNINDTDLEYIHDIENYKKNSEKAYTEFDVKGNDPIFYLPKIDFKSDNQYIFEIDAIGVDDIWQLFYLTKENSNFNEKESIRFNVQNFSKNNDKPKSIILPDNLIPQKLRLDPGSKNGKSIIKKLKIYEIDINSKKNLIFKHCNSMSTLGWRNMLLLSVKNPIIGDMHFPGFPPPKYQEGMVNTSGEETIIEIFSFYDELNKAINKLSWSFSSKTKIMDFGCGFGRLTRCFLKDVPYGNIFGVDTTNEFITLCRNIFPKTCIPHKNFINNNPFPPLNFDNNSLDLITAYSVFTHLSEEAANKWIDEFYRILKPGGLVAVTLRQRIYLEQIKFLGTLKNIEGYNLIQVKAFGNYPERIAQYENGEFMFYPSGGGKILSNKFYGDTIIPENYIIKNWSGKFIIREMFDDSRRVPQAFLLMQKI